MARHHAPHPRTKSNPHATAGKGGSRKGYHSSNEIEDMEIFDSEPEKEPTHDHRHSAKSIDDSGYRKRK